MAAQGAASVAWLVLCVSCYSVGQAQRKTRGFLLPFSKGNFNVCYLSESWVFM